MKCQLIGYVRRDYVKDGKENSILELHLVRSPFANEKGFVGHVSKKYVVFGKEVVDSFPKLIIDEQYSVEVQVSGNFENIAEMILLPKS